MKPKDVARWSVVALSGGYGFYTLLTSIQSLVREFSAFILVITLCCSALFLVPAYFLARRQYRQLVVFLALLAALIVWGLLISLPERLGLHAWIDQWRHRPIHSPRDDWPILIFAPLEIFLGLIFPIWAAIRFFRLILRVATRWLYGHSPTPGNA